MAYLTDINEGTTAPYDPADYDPADPQQLVNHAGSREDGACKS